MNFVLDTNILILLIREDSRIQKEISDLGVFNPANFTTISIASVGEILSFALQNKWGSKKIINLERLILTLSPISIVKRDLLETYAEIDAYSKSKLDYKPLPKGLSSRTMGKNDLWIAATTYLTQSTLITTDADFDHLNGLYFPVIKLSAKV
jgi:tRNA(fMet)-specific endonuclease VapC